MFAEIRKAGLFPIDGVQAREHLRGRAVHRAPFGSAHAFEARVLEHAALDAFHEIARRADDGPILAVNQHAWNGDTTSFERANNARFAIECVGARKQLARRLHTQHQTLRAGVDEPRWIRLAAQNMLERERLANTELASHKRLQTFRPFGLLHGFDHNVLTRWPPSTGTTAPVMYSDASEASNSTGATRCSSSPTRRCGMRFMMASPGGVEKKSRVISVMM